MGNTAFTQYKVDDRSYVSFIKREIHNVVTQAGFNSSRAGEVDIIISELASNLIKHASRGEFIYRLSEENNNKALEVFCIDNGPGTNNINRMMKDGQSSSNTLGQGLGSINRLSDVFQIYSKEGWGTIAYSKKFMNAVSDNYTAKSAIELKAIQVPLPGERLCGDGYHIKVLGNETHIFCGDGLGHGPHAYDAVQTAIEAFNTYEGTGPVDILRHIHGKVKKTRGLVGTVAILNHNTRQWKIAGVGNISTRLYVGIVPKNFMSYNGIIGMNIPNSMNDYVADEEKHQMIVMCSDGIKSRWDLTKYPSLFKYDPSIIASTIFKDHARNNDDMTVLVGKVNM